MTWTEIITLVIAGVSLVLSVVVFFRQRQAAGRAHFTGGWDDRSTVVYVNHGPGAAHNVTVSLDAKHVEGLTNVEYLAPLQDMRINLTRELCERPPKSLGLTWRDNRRGAQSVSVPLVPSPPREPKSKAPTRGTLENAIREVARDEAMREMTKQARRGMRNRRKG